jgi:gustatory receptor
MVKWIETESYFSYKDYPMPPESWILKKRIFFSTVLYLFVSTLEHVFYHLSEIYKYVYDVQMCKPEGINLVEAYVFRHLSFIIKHLPFSYNHFIGVGLEYLNFSYTFYWNFLDLFIILISIGMSFLFEKVNWRLQNYKGLLVNQDVWAEIRFHYVKVCELLQICNNKMGAIITIACFIDGYFILVQLLNITT